MIRRLGIPLIAATTALVLLVVAAVWWKDRADEDECAVGINGIPRHGAFVGAGVSGTSDLTQREDQLGSALPLHRVFFEADQLDYAMDVINQDVADGRLPWASFKLPTTWEGAARGDADAWARELGDRLAAVDGPVWVALHHEPEGDGDIQQWSQVQRRLSPVVSSAHNVAFSVILTGWTVLFGPDDTYRLETVWPGDEYVDILGIDVYNDYGAVRNGRLGQVMLRPDDYFEPVSAFARAHGAKWAVGEIGYTSAAVQRDPQWLSGAYDDLVKHQGIAMAYFDSSMHSIADWTLDDPDKWAEFAHLVSKSQRICG